jgi:hypothetical protein
MLLGLLVYEYVIRRANILHSRIMKVAGRGLADHPVAIPEDQGTQEHGLCALKHAETLSDGLLVPPAKIRPTSMSRG